MKKKLTLEWLYAAVARAVKTMAQTALGMFTVGAAMSDVNWVRIGSVSLVAGIYSILTSLATGLPEAVTDGTLQVDMTNSKKDTYRFVIDDLDALHTKKFVRLAVNPNANLSQK